MSELESVLDKDKKRYQLLRKLWEISNGFEEFSAQWLDLVKTEGFDEDTAEDTYQFLSKAGLIKAITIGWFVSITNQGIQEIERSIKNPDR